MNTTPTFRTTPWGPADHVTTIADGIHFISTPGHGGFHLDAKRNATIPEADKAQTWNQQGRRGWYEEDCDQALVVIHHPNAFSLEDLQRAEVAWKRYQDWKQSQRSLF